MRDDIPWEMQMHDDCWTRERDLRTRLAAAEGRADRLEAALIWIANLTTGSRAAIGASVHDTAMAALAGVAKEEG